MNGLLKIQPKKILIQFIHGFVILAVLAIAQLLLDASQISFFTYNPPIGFAFFILVAYGIQPLIVGALNVALTRQLHELEGWRTDFWISGLFLLLVFTTINLLLLTVAHLPLSPALAAAETIVLAYPFGYLGKFSNA